MHLDRQKTDTTKLAAMLELSTGLVLRPYVANPKNELLGLSPDTAGKSHTFFKEFY